jgi:hypothetical protein
MQMLNVSDDKSEHNVFYLQFHWKISSFFLIFEDV